MRGVRSALALAILFLLAIGGYVVLQRSADRLQRQLTQLPPERRVAVRLLTKQEPAEKWIRDFQQYQRMRKLGVGAAWEEVARLAPAGMLYLDDAALVDHYRILHQAAQRLPDAECAQLAGMITDRNTVSKIFVAVDSASRDRLVEHTVVAGIMMAHLKSPPPQLQPFETQDARRLLDRVFTPQQAARIARDLATGSNHGQRCRAVRDITGSIATLPLEQAALLARGIHGGALN